MRSEKIITVRLYAEQHQQINHGQTFRALLAFLPFLCSCLIFSAVPVLPSILLFLTLPLSLLVLFLRFSTLCGLPALLLTGLFALLLVQLLLLLRGCLLC